MNADGVTHLELARVGFLLLFLDGTDDLVHNDPFRYRERNIDLSVCAPSPENFRG
jgi:hypothetical protein